MLAILGLATASWALPGHATSHRGGVPVRDSLQDSTYIFTFDQSLAHSAIPGPRPNMKKSNPLLQDSAKGWVDLCQKLAFHGDLKSDKERGGYMDEVRATCWLGREHWADPFVLRIPLQIDVQSAKLSATLDLAHFIAPGMEGELMPGPDNTLVPAEIVGDLDFAHTPSFFPSGKQLPPPADGAMHMRHLSYMKTVSFKGTGLDLGALKANLTAYLICSLSRDQLLTDPFSNPAGPPLLVWGYCIFDKATGTVFVSEVERPH